MHKLRLVPLGNESVEERVAAFRQYNDEVRNEVYPSFKRTNLLGTILLKAHLLLRKMWKNKKNVGEQDCCLWQIVAWYYLLLFSYLEKHVPSLVCNTFS